MGLPLVLASASPRRRELLLQAGVSPRIFPARIDEAPRPGEAAAACVLRLAAEKAASVAAALDAAALVLAADTAVVVDGTALGKPTSSRDALAMLRRLRGRRHEVLTGLCLLRSDDGRRFVHVETTGVHFREIDDEVLAAYAAGDEPRDKAGAYGIQGRAGLFVHSIDGSWSNVVGLPLERLAEAFTAVGSSLWSRVAWSAR